MSRAIPVSNLSELESLTRHNDKVVVVFSALAWCVPCQRLAPHVAQASEKLPEVVFAEVDVDTADPALMDKFSIMGVPTVYALQGDKATVVKGRTVVQLIQEVSAL